MDKELKKRVLGDWQNAFPQLSLYSANSLLKVIGPVIIGLNLVKLSAIEKYRPHFVVYSLFGNRIGNDAKACLDYPIILKEYYNKKGLQYDIPYKNHDIFFDDMLDSVKKQSPLSFEGDVSLNEILSMIDEYANTQPLSASRDSYFQAVLQAEKLKIILFVNSTGVQSILEQINKQNWSVNHFNAFGINLNEWLHHLQTLPSNRDKLLKQVELIKQDKKIAKLKSSQLIL